MKINKTFYNRQISKIETEVCLAYNTSPQTLQNKTRDSDVALPRQIVMALSRDIFDALTSYALIGGYYNKDHATAIHAKKQINNYRETNKGFSTTYENIKTEAIKRVLKHPLKQDKKSIVNDLKHLLNNPNLKGYERARIQKIINSVKKNMYCECKS